VRRHDGTLLGAFQAERAPGPLGGQQPSCGEPPQVLVRGELLHAVAAVCAKKGSPGMLEMGFSQAELRREQERDVASVAWVSLLVLALGLFAAALFGRVLVRR